MHLQQLFVEGLGHGSYLVGDPAAGAGAVVDPRRDVDGYLAAAQAAGRAAVGAVVAAAGSVLPDVDSPGPGVWGPRGQVARGPRGQVARGRPALAAATPLTWPLAVVLYRAWGHRGPTHALLCPLLELVLAGAFVLARAARGGGRTLALGLVVGFLVVGVLAHILEDALTPLGCPLLWPLRPLTRRYRLRPLAWTVLGIAGVVRAGAGVDLLLRRVSHLMGTAYRRWRSVSPPASRNGHPLRLEPPGGVYRTLTRP